MTATTLTVHPLIQRWWKTRGLPLLCLAALHTALLLSFDTWPARAALLVHFGTLLLWQPIIRPANPLNQKLVFAVILLGAGVTSGYPPFLLLWTTLVASILAGQLFATRLRTTRWFHLGIVVYLIWIIAVALAPNALNQSIPLYSVLLNVGASILMLLLLLPIDNTRHEPLPTVDFLLSLTVLLILVFVVLGGLAVSLRSGLSYVLSMAATALAMAGLVYLFTSLWSNHGSQAGWQLRFSQYLLNISTPFERWTATLANLAALPLSPQEFLTLATAELNEMNWLQGGRWHYGKFEREFGELRGQAVSFTYDKLTLDLFSENAMPSALRLHCQLLTQLISEFTQAKEREITLENQAYLQAVHETGAKLTHDIKNVLQALQTLMGAANTSTPESAPQLVQLFQRQLPGLSTRLEHLVERLKVPAQQQNERRLPAVQWWQLAQERYSLDKIVFETTRVREADELPAEVFNTVLDNLLSNALYKQQSDQQVEIRCRLEWDNGVVLSVEDSGAPLSKITENHLFNAPIASAQGLGIGLYQTQQLAHRFQYHLSLESNLKGNVLFKLKPLRQTASSDHSGVE